MLTPATMWGRGLSILCPGEARHNSPSLSDPTKRGSSSLAPSGDCAPLELFKLMEVYSVLIVVVTVQMCAFAQTHQIVYLKRVHVFSVSRTSAQLYKSSPWFFLLPWCCTVFQAAWEL